MFDLRGDLTAIEQRITKMFRRKGEPKSTSGSYGRYTPRGLSAATRRRGRRSTSRWNMGALSTNEIRAYEELAPVDGGDIRYRPLNMGGLGTVDTSQSTTGSSPHERIPDLPVPRLGEAGAPVRAALAPEPQFTEPGVAVMRLYDPIDSWGDVWGVSAAEFVSALDAPRRTPPRSGSTSTPPAGRSSRRSRS